MFKWEDCAVEFAFDGCVREIIIKGLTVESWQTLYTFLLSQENCAYEVDAEPATAPSHIAEILEIQSEHGLKLYFSVRGIEMFVPYFYDEDFATIIFSPKDIDSQEKLDTLLGFSQHLANLLDLPVDIDQEGFNDWRIFTLYPGSQKPTYHAPRCTEFIDNRTPIVRTLSDGLSALMTWEGLFKRKK